ncbi:hypothetical protein [Oceanobacillus polygoni]|uniref:Uncharacterized protein n=1 Tax=Oceanobacillus polygoni TaxID=1235259 RepID=A0A9X1CKM8_9BACI|nr:hypothetical protein [Oceanobacillus polygoni]MBP2079648.1 hypothetical protein [Oceanobacillus polygoni]
MSEIVDIVNSYKLDEELVELKMSNQYDPIYTEAVDKANEISRYEKADFYITSYLNETEKVCHFYFSFHYFDDDPEDLTLKYTGYTVD